MFDTRAARFDLHMHSTSSDGTVAPEELATWVEKAGLEGFSLTDHDTVEGLEKARQGALEKGLVFLSGIEISSNYLGKSVHILGYGFDSDSTTLHSFLESQRKARLERNHRLLQNLLKKDIKIDEARLLARAKGSVGRVHIAQEMVALGYVSSIQEAFNQWIGDRAPCYVPSGSPSPDICIQAIHKAQGKVLLAHPHLMEASHAKKVLKDFAWDGLEVFYGRFDLSRQRPWLEWSEKKNWVFSGGSDFHGEVKPETYIGSSWIDETALKKLLEGTYSQSLGVL
jgi:predicted metal-dependent phosphoesterase TrpH